MDFIVNNYKGLTAILNDSTTKDTCKAKIKFSDEFIDENNLIEGTVIYGRFKEYDNSKGYKNTTWDSLYTFVFNEETNSGFEWCEITPELFIRNNPKGFHIEYIEMTIEV